MTAQFHGSPGHRCSTGDTVLHVAHEATLYIRLYGSQHLRAAEQGRRSYKRWLATTPEDRRVPAWAIADLLHNAIPQLDGPFRTAWAETRAPLHTSGDNAFAALVDGIPHDGSLTGTRRQGADWAYDALAKCGWTVDAIDDYRPLRR